jgi:multiple sugar transport system substrate-binding protein
MHERLSRRSFLELTGLATAISGTLIPTYAARGAHRRLDDLIKADPDSDLEDCYQPIRRISSFNGKTYAIESDVAPTAMYYNKAPPQKQGIELPSRTEPMPWATFRELVIELTKPPDQYGFTHASDDGAPVLLLEQRNRAEAGAL